MLAVPAGHEAGESWSLVAGKAGEMVVGAGIIALAAWLTWRLAPVITPFAISAGLAYLGDPLVDRLEKWHFFRWKFSRTVAVVLVFVLMTALFGLVLLILSYLLAALAPGWGQWLRDLATPGALPQIFHCTAGKDRTGVCAALILLSAGVRTIVLDYQSEQLEMLRAFGIKVFFGDAMRPDLLHAAGNLCPVVAVPQPRG